MLSSHYQGTPFDPYGTLGTQQSRSRYRTIGINRNGQLAVLQLRPYAPEAWRAVQWMAFGSNPFNALVPFYTSVDALPEYLGNTTSRVTSESFYWANRLIAALADARFHENSAAIEGYRQEMAALGHAMLHRTDAAAAKIAVDEVPALLERANDDLASELKRATEELLGKVLYTTSCAMRNAFSMSDNER